jgi:hypothetical protein
MEPENLDIEQITEDRRKAIEKSIEVISSEDLKSLGEKLFPFLDHPWRQTFFEFIEENASQTFYHATTHDAIEIVCCPRRAYGSKEEAWVPGARNRDIEEIIEIIERSRTRCLS